MRVVVTGAGRSIGRLHEQWDGTVETLVGPEGRPGPEIVGHAVGLSTAQ